MAALKPVADKHGLTLPEIGQDTHCAANIGLPDVVCSLEMDVLPLSAEARAWRHRDHWRVQRLAYRIQPLGL